MELKAIEWTETGGPHVTGGNPGCPAKDNSPLAIDPGGIPGNPANPGGRPGVPGGAIPGGNPGIPGMPGIPPLAACCLKIRDIFIFLILQFLCLFISIYNLSFID